MRGKPGIIVKWSDDERLFIIYNAQPLLNEKGRVLLHIIDQDYNPVMENGKQKILIQPIEVYNERVQAAKVLGYID